MELHDSRHALSRAVPPAADHGAALRVRVPVERVYDAHFDYVLSNLRRLGVDDHELEDAAQDVFLIVLRRREAFEGRSSVRSWIFGITRRVAWRYRRSAQRTLRRRAVLAREPREQPVGLDGALAEHQAQELLRAFLDSLKRPQREAFILGELEGLQRRELGRALGVSPNTAYSRLRLARARFAATFENSVRRDMLLQRWRARQREPAREQRVWLALSPLLTPLAKAGPLTWLSGQSGWTLGKLLAGVSLVGVVALALPSARRSAADASAASKEVDVGADARTRGGHGDAARSDGPEPATGDSAWAHSPFTLFEDDDERGASRDRRPARRRAPAATATRSSSPSTSPSPSPSSSPSPSTSTSPSTSPSRTRDPADEDMTASLRALAAIREAHARGETALARARLQQHARRWPESLFSIDRAVLEIDILCAQGDAGAPAAIARFLARHGDSPQAARVRRGCVARPR